TEDRLLALLGRPYDEYRTPMPRVPLVKNYPRLGTMGIMLSGCTTGGAFTPDWVVGRPSSDAARLHAKRRIFNTSHGDRTVPDSFTRQLPRNQEFAIVTLLIRMQG
ncbi:MAG: hypothetical protein JWO52_2946, partial [Gammaproteobacteria bacterium]|nr:hypothetical protein [Gammaproteobacteria bacterium]